MKTTIVLAHPWHGSFNKAILDTITQKLNGTAKPYQVIDLCKDEFNPVLQEHDLAIYSKGQTTDQLVLKYQEMLRDTRELVFVFPVWWYDVPAILKGFIDKVMLKDFSFVETKTRLKGLLTHIEKTTVISTSDVPTWYLKWLRGNAIKSTFIKSTLKDIGLRKVKWLNHDLTSSGKQERRLGFLDKVKSLF